MEQYEACEQGTKWFLARDCFRRSLHRIGVELDLLIDDNQPKEKLSDHNKDELAVFQKQVRVALDLAKVWAKSERAMTDAVYDKFSVSVQFSRLKPAVRPPCPCWLRQLCLSRQIEVSL